MDSQRSRAASPRLPGVVTELLKTGEIADETPGLDDLARALFPGWWRFTAEGERIDQSGWPARSDVALAYCAVQRMGACAAEGALLAEIGDWLAGRVDGRALEARRPEVFAKTLGASLGRETSDDDALRCLAAMRPNAGEAERRAVLAARRLSPADHAACVLAATARKAADGWAAYHAHRGLASESAVFAAGVIRLAMRAGAVTGADVVAWARAEVVPWRPDFAALGRSLGSPRRPENLDAFHVEPGLGLYLVVDGALDRSSTDAALRAFVASVRASLSAARVEAALPAAVLAAHAAVRGEASRGAVAELVAVILDGSRARIASVGACRCWLARSGEVSLRTVDDVLTIGGPVEPPGIDWNDPESWDPTPRVLGGDHAPRVCERSLDLDAGDTLLLSSDALGWLDEDEARVLRALERADGMSLAALLDLLLPADWDGDDDATALLVRVG